MQFGMEKYALLTMKNGKRAEGKELLSQGRIRILGENENYKYLGILEVDIIK